MRTHDNSGQGNCLYYAYAISLMYHIKSCGQYSLLKMLPSKLGVNQEDHSTLIQILDATNVYFTKSQKQLIEKILGQKLRELAVQHLIKNYQEKPNEANIRSAIEYHFKQLLAPNNNSYKELFQKETIHTEIDVNQYDYTAISDYLRNDNNVTNELINDLDSLGKHITICITNDLIIKKYMSKAATNGIWGTDETLCALHQAISSLSPDTPISLGIYKNKQQTQVTELQSDIIINNQGNRHWYSIIHPVTDLKILAICNSNLKSDIDKILDNNANCHKLLNNYIKKDNDVIDTTKKNAALEILKIHNQLLSAIAYHLNAGKPLNSCVEYTILNNTLKLIDKITQNDPEKSIQDYKTDIKSYTSFWAKNGKAITKILKTVRAIFAGIGLGLLCCANGIGTVAGVAISVGTAYLLSPRFFKASAEEAAANPVATTKINNAI